MIGIRYISPVYDYSGYGHAARGYIFSLYRRGVPITLNPRNFDPNPPTTENEENGKILSSLINKSIPYDVNIIHLTPDLYPLYIERGKYNIGFMAWETSRLHPRWVHSINNSVDELWVPCEWNVQAVKESGVQVPVYKIPHGIDPDMFNFISDKEFFIKGVSNSTYKFYSIFQWSNRKNPEGLLRSYFNAFTVDDDVVLILKTYLSGKGQDASFIRDRILNIKKDMGLSSYPRVILISDLLSKVQMLGLHTYGDCYVGLHRGEGWGLPCCEAGVCGNAVVATNGGGNLEFMKKENSYLIDARLTYTEGMSSFNPWYSSRGQCWYDPSLIHASELMRKVYDNKEEASIKGGLLRDYIVTNFSWDSVSDLVIDKLNLI